MRSTPANHGGQSPVPVAHTRDSPLVIAFDLLRASDDGPTGRRTPDDRRRTMDAGQRSGPHLVEQAQIVLAENPTNLAVRVATRDKRAGQIDDLRIVGKTVERPLR